MWSGLCSGGGDADQGNGGDRVGGWEWSGMGVDGTAITCGLEAVVLSHVLSHDHFLLFFSELHSCSRLSVGVLHFSRGTVLALLTSYFFFVDVYRV